MDESLKLDFSLYIKRCSDTFLVDGDLCNNCTKYDECLEKWIDRMAEL